MKILAAVVLLSALAASAEERWDHRGAVGLLLGAGADLRSSLGEGAQNVDNGGRPLLEVGGTASLTERAQIHVAGRLVPWNPLSGELMLGLRRLTNSDRWKTYLDVDLAAYLATPFTVGPHFAVGVQYELSPIMGVYASLGTHLGFGNGLRLLVEGVVGVQFRSYLLEN
jgi:hypothetical protein